VKRMYFFSLCSYMGSYTLAENFIYDILIVKL